nr:type I methionyl aminopeptidase [Clostridia bacterium]
MISIKNAAQIDKMRAAGKLLHEVLCALRSEIHPGVTTKQLDAYAHKLITQAGAIPSFLGYQ